MIPSASTDQIAAVYFPRHVRYTRESLRKPALSRSALAFYASRFSVRKLIDARRAGRCLRDDFSDDSTSVTFKWHVARRRAQI